MSLQNKKKAKNVRKVESPLKSSSPVVTRKKRLAAEAFVPRVNEVLPTKHNKTNTVEYFDIRLQTETSPSQRAVCFSKNKRQLFVDRQKTKTPIKLTNYSMSENKSDILINNMTRASKHLCSVLTLVAERK